MQASDLPSNLPSLGLLQTTEGFALCSKSLSYNFLHLSVQELLAAYLISQMDCSEQVKVFMKLFGSPRFQSVLQYYCGFTKLDNPEIKQFISSHHSDMSELWQFLPILKCFFEAKQPSLSQLVDPTMFMDTNSMEEIYEQELTPVDFLAVGYFIVSFLSTCGHESNNTPTLYFDLDQPVDGHCLKLLLDELSKNPIGGLQTSTGALSQKLVLKLYVPHINIEALKYLASYLKTFSLIGEVTLKSRKEGVVPIEFVVEMLHTNNSITKLSLQYDLHEFRNLLTIKCAHLNKPLTELHLSSLSDELLHIIIAHLQYSTTLVKLSISKTQSVMTVETARALTIMLELNKFLTNLVVSHSKHFSDSEAFCVFKGLQHNTTLISLDLSNCDITAADPEIIKSLMLQENSSLTHLNLSGNIGFSDSGARCIFESLQYNSTLVYLNLGGTSITANDPDTAKSLTKMLQVNKSLTHLDLSCKVTVPANHIVSLIFSALEHNTTLLHLVLRGREILKDDAECIAQALKSNQSLLTIDISRAYYHCRSAMICRDDLELRWRLLMCENEFSHISILLYISTAF